MPSSHEARSVPWQSCCIGALQYHTNPCVQIVTDAALINSTTAAMATMRPRHAAGYSAGRRELLARLAPFLEPLHHREERWYEQHRQAGRRDHPGEYRHADRHACAGAGAAREHERHDAEDEGE